ncbi:hypothetical protein FOL47_004403 [Perkinsus chesapeaki]|uniref:DNA-directed RNA polymerase III subunit RPC4 n=1 Tax=Perkinsus chesapeaki TaxID=330153 RepID=A0A7J6M425_PERCH|nr:hypothetical protein FOL47_004403 [Perkinsus chesapeaki]
MQQSAEHIAATTEAVDVPDSPQFIQTLSPVLDRNSLGSIINSYVPEQHPVGDFQKDKIQEERDETREQMGKYVTVEEAMAALSTLTRRDFAELRNLPSPPEGVLSVARGICLALGIKPKRRSSTGGIVGSSDAPQEYWKAAREHVFATTSASSLLQKLVFFDKDKVSDKTVRLLAALVDTAPFQNEIVSGTFVASKALARWLSHVVGYCLASGDKRAGCSKPFSSPSASSRGRRQTKPGTEKLQPASVRITSTVLGIPGQRKVSSSSTTRDTAPPASPAKTHKHTKKAASGFTPLSRRSPPPSDRQQMATPGSAKAKPVAQGRPQGSGSTKGALSSEGVSKSTETSLKSAKASAYPPTPSSSVKEAKKESSRPKVVGARSLSPAIRTASSAPKATASAASLRLSLPGKARPSGASSAPRSSRPLSARSSTVRLSARGQIRGKEEDNWRRTLEETRREIRELKALESRILWNMRREEKLSKKRIEHEAQKDLTEWRRKHETKLREGIEAYRKSIQDRELKENLESVRFKRERKMRAKKAELEQHAKSYDERREKAIQREIAERERALADEALRADQREDRAEIKQLLKVKEMEDAMKERSERSWERSVAMEFERKQLEAEKNRRLKSSTRLDMSSSLKPGGSPAKQRRLRKFAEPNEPISSSSSTRKSVKIEAPAQDQRPRHGPVRVRPILPVERLASFKRESTRSMFGGNESPFRPKSSGLSSSKFAPKRPDARTVGSDEPMLAKAIGKVAREMAAARRDEGEEPMPTSVKVILMNAMKESAERKRKDKMKGNTRVTAVSSSSRSISAPGLRLAKDVLQDDFPFKEEKRKRIGPLLERPLDDVAFGTAVDDIQEYPPLSVPYYSTLRISPDILQASGYSAETSHATDRPKGKRPVLLEAAAATVEQESSGASHLFLNRKMTSQAEEEGSAVKEDQFFVVQLPTTFPRVIMDDEEAEKSKDKAISSSASEVATFNEVPDGKIGSLRVHKSGRVSLLIGGIEYSCALGQKPKFAQEVACVLPTQGEIIFLGEIENKLIVSPKI